MINERGQYIPSVEEVKLAEKSMDDKDRLSSEARAENWEQKQVPWEECEGDFNENGERRELTAEESKKMSELIKGLGELLAGANVRWRLDGAINISLMMGEFIGFHKDIDISVEKSDLKQLESCLEKKGYAFFHSYFLKETGEVVRRRVGHDRIASSMIGNYLIIAVDKNGRIVKNKEPNFIDLHVVERNANSLPVNRSGVVMPEKWLDTQVIKYESKNINISHPALVAYYKLQQGRSYDLKDLNILAETGRLTLQDIEEIEEIMEKTLVSSQQKGRDVMSEVAEKIRNGMSSSEILQVLAKNPILKDSIEYQKELFVKLSEKIAESADKSADAIAKSAFKVFDVENVTKQIFGKVKTLKQWAVDNEKNNPKK